MNEEAPPVLGCDVGCIGTLKGGKSHDSEPNVNLEADKRVLDLDGCSERC